MRTTLTIDDDVASKLRPLLKGGKPKKVINDLLRKALGLRRASDIDLPVFRLELHPDIDPSDLNRIAEQLAVEDDVERFLRENP